MDSYTAGCRGATHKYIVGDKNECPVILPCEHHENTPDAGSDFLRTFIKTLLLPEDGLAVSYMIPFAATDTWIVAALDQYDDYEILPDPWGDIITHSPQYHGVKIKNRPKKRKMDIRKVN